MPCAICTVGTSGAAEWNPSWYPMVPAESTTMAVAR